MTILVTGSAGHLGEALMRLLRDGDDEEEILPPRTITTGTGNNTIATSSNVEKRECLGLDIRASPYTDLVGSISDADFCRKTIVGQPKGKEVSAIIHTASLHKPHVETHSRQDFVDVNITGTLNLLEAAIEEGQRRQKENTTEGASASASSYPTFVFLSTTSSFGDALKPTTKHPEATWIDETTIPIPKNIYGVTKLAAENMCQLFHKLYGIPCVVLKVSRFFPEDDDMPSIREICQKEGAKLNELLHRRADIYDMATACLQAVDKGPELGHETFVISGDSPFQEKDRPLLTQDAPSVIESYYPGAQDAMARHQLSVFPTMDRVYCNGPSQGEIGVAAPLHV